MSRSSAVHALRRRGRGGSDDHVQDLLAAIKSGSEPALEALVRMYSDALLRYAAAGLGDVDCAKDVVQETFRHVWERRATWSPSGSSTGYLFRITRNLLVSEYRRREVRGRWRQHAAGEMTSRPLSPAHVFEEKQLWEAFDAAVAALSERRRQAFLLVHVQGLTHAQAAANMGVVPRTVSNQVAAALRELRGALADAEN